MKKKLLALLVVLVLVLGVTMITSTAEESTTSGHSHCVCGGNLTDPVAIAQHGDCTETTEWIAITATNMKKGGLLETGTYSTSCLKFAKNGAYYLTSDIKMTKPLEIVPGQEITICLNGHKLYCTIAYSLIYAHGGVLNICDCTGNGYLTNSNSTGAENGGIIYLYTKNADANGTVVNMYGGSLKDSKATASGGIVKIHDAAKELKAEFNLYGGTISGGSAKRGGNIYINSASGKGQYAVLNIYGGSIVDGQVSGTGSYDNRGGNIYALNGQIHMYGGAVTGGIYQTDTSKNSKPFGADICISKNTNTALELYGKICVGEIAVGGDKSEAIGLGENFETEQPIRVTIVDSFNYLYLASGANESHLDDFVYVGDNMAGYKLGLVDGYLMMVEDDVERGHCYCGGAAENSADHKCDKSVAWEAWDGTTELANGGRYHLTDTDGDGIVTVSNTIELTDKTVSVCLQGLQLDSDTQVFLLSGTARLNICDCVGGGSISGGEVEGNGGTICVSEGCSFQLFAGTISGGKSSNYGGNIYCAGTATLYGGTVDGGYATNRGGNIYVSTTGALTLAGATISNGATDTETENTGYGGNIYAYTGAPITMTGGYVVDGVARSAGNIWAAGSFSMSKGIISGGHSTAACGNLRINGASGSLSITGGKILNGISDTSQGGNIFFHSNVTAAARIEDAQIIGGTAGTNGGNIYVPSSVKSLTINNCTITGGQAKTYGGNLYVTTPQVTITSSIISGGVTGERGGNIYAVGASLTLDDCKILDGSVVGVRDENGELTEVPYGYNIFFNNNSTAELSLVVKGCTITGQGQENLANFGFNIFPSGKAVDIRFGGELTIDRLRVGTDRQIIIEDLAETSAIGMETQEIPALFAPSAQAYATNFYALNEDYMVIATSEGLEFTSAAPYWAYAASGATIGGYDSLEEAAQAEGCAYVGLNRDHDAQGETFMDTVYLDLNGFDLTGLNLVGTIYGADSKTANYASTSYGKLNVTLGEGGVIAPYYTFTNGLEGMYLTLKDGEAYTFHKLGVEITHLSLDTTKAGFGYKAKFQVNPQGAALMDHQIVSYGFYMGVAGGEMKTFELTGAKTEFTLRLKNILTEGGDKNAEYALMDIIAIPFVKINVGQENPLEITGKAQTQNMKGCVKAVEQVIMQDPDALSNDQLVAFQNFCEKYADVVEPSMPKPGALKNGDKIIFIGNSLTYYGKCVLEKGQSTFEQSKRTNDKGYFYQICKANGIEVNVTNFTFGGHTLKDFYSGNCQADRGHDGTNHLAYMDDFDYDYVVFQEGTYGSGSSLLGECKVLMNLFLQGNPNTKFVFLVHHRAYDNILTSLMYSKSNITELKNAGFIVVDWGKLVTDVISSGKIAGGTMKYNKWTFIVNKSSSDGYHENILAGYITAQMTYCAITGQSAVGQYYGFWNDTKASSRFDYDNYMATYYANGDNTNFDEVFNNPSEMLALQQLMDEYLAK